MMKIIMQYEGEENIAKLWSYISKKEYTCIDISQDCK